jgi:Transcriptional regulator/sugar kinase
MLDELSNIQKERAGAILRAVLVEGRITRRRLCEILNLSPSSVVKYIRSLIDMGILRESGTDADEAGQGRKSEYLEFDDSSGASVAIVMDATKVEGALAKPSGELVQRRSVSVRRGIPKEELIELVYGLADSLVAQARDGGLRIWGSGVALGGGVDPSRGVSREYLYSSNWYDVPLGPLFESRYGFPCCLVKDSHAAALGELYYGRCRGMSDFLSLWLGEGIGLGIVSGGELCSGARCNSGELGHSRLEEGRALCYCGHTGCLETEANAAYVLDRCREGLAQGVKSKIGLACGAHPEALTLEMAVDAANDGDRFAMNVFSGVAERVGRKLADAVNLLDPEAIALSGELVEGNPYLATELERALETYCLTKPEGGGFVLSGLSGQDIRLKGVGAEILRRIFDRSA